jgi:hypothetical protein
MILFLNETVVVTIKELDRSIPELVAVNSVVVLDGFLDGFIEES